MFEGCFLWKICIYLYMYVFFASSISCYADDSTLHNTSPTSKVRESSNPRAPPRPRRLCTAREALRRRASQSVYNICFLMIEIKYLYIFCVYIKREGDVSFTHPQTVGPRKMKFGVYILSTIYGWAKKWFFEIRNLRQKGPQNVFSAFFKIY